MTDRADMYTKVLARAEDAVVNNRVGQWVGLSIAILLALSVAAMASDVIF